MVLSLFSIGKRRVCSATVSPPSILLAFAAAFISSCAFAPFSAIKLPPTLHSGRQSSDKTDILATARAVTTENFSRYFESLPTSSRSEEHTSELQSRFDLV